VSAPARGLDAFARRHEVAWELAFAALAIFFVALGALPEDTPGLEALEWAITGIFAIEFFGRLLTSGDERGYLRAHWIDVVTLIPPVRGLRVLRLLRLLRLLRAFAGVARALGHVERIARHRGLLALLTAWLGVMVITSMGLYVAEVGLNEAVTSPLDALWWGVTTMTTVGYGDVYPVTAEGRLAAMTLMILGIGLYSAITAVVTSVLIAPSPTTLAGELDRLAALHADGSITDAEFDAAKASVIGGNLRR
jgi:voltage-gated potassium channel